VALGHHCWASATPRRASPTRFDRAFTNNLRQHCLIHSARNVIAKDSAHDQAEVKAGFWKIFDVGEAEPGDEAVSVARRQSGEFAAKWKAHYPRRGRVRHRRPRVLDGAPALPGRTLEAHTPLELTSAIPDSRSASSLALGTMPPSAQAASVRRSR